MSIDLILENAQLKGRVIALDAEVKCLEAVIRAHERIDCRAVTNLKKQLVEADAENARLKAEVERLRKGDERDMTAAYLYAAEQYKAENARRGAVVKAKVDAIGIKHLVDSDCVDMVVGHIRKLEAENERLKAEVERLTKELKNTDCMFAMASAFARDWNAAKEGKQS
jgi:cell division protein FtsB